MILAGPFRQVWTGSCLAKVEAAMADARVAETEAVSRWGVILRRQVATRKLLTRAKPTFCGEMRRGEQAYHLD